MSWEFSPYALPVIISAGVSAVLAYASWQRRPAPGAIAFCLLMLAVAEWSLGYALELLSPDLTIKIVWDNIAWFGAACAPTLWLVFVLQHTNRAAWLTRRNLALLVIEPFVTIVLVWTNQWHGLVESSIKLDDSGSFSTLAMTYGAWYWVNIAYSYLLLLIGAVLIWMLIHTLLRSAHPYIGQASALLLAVVAPWMGNALTAFGLNPFPKLDLTPFAFTISGLAVAWSLFFFRLLDILPIAREAVFERMSDAVIIVDEQNRVVDLNAAARGLADCTAWQAFGQLLPRVFAAWPELVEQCRNASGSDEYAEITLHEDDARRYFDVRITPLHHQNAQHTIAGRLIVLNDITEHKQAERVLKESEERFRDIFEEAPIGMAVVGRDDQLLQVNKAFCDMLGFEEQELAALPLALITHPDDLRKDALLAAQMPSGIITSYKVEKRYLRKNRETLWVDLTTTILHHQDGQAIYRLVMIENIIERKRARLLEEERHQVAYDLHDGLAQIVASTHQHLQAFASSYRPRSPHAREELERTLDLAQRAVREARQLIAGLRPTALDDFGLATALGLHIEAQRTNNLTIKYEDSLGSERLPPTIETALFRVAQEALTNIQKHSHTDQMRVALERREVAIRLEVQDWGCGFDVAAVLGEASLGEHVGLREMQERIELVGGYLLITSQAGTGTLLVAEVPLPPSQT